MPDKWLIKSALVCYR